jgi:hypothetical protein
MEKKELLDPAESKPVRGARSTLLYRLSNPDSLILNIKRSVHIELTLVADKRLPSFHSTERHFTSLDHSSRCTEPTVH